VKGRAMKDDISIVGIVIQLRECGIKGNDEKVMEKEKDWYCH